MSLLIHNIGALATMTPGAGPGPLGRGLLGMVRQAAVVTEADRIRWCGAEAKALGHSVVRLSAQCEAIPFYLHLRYETEGPEYIEAGIPHQRMYKTLDG